MERASDLLAPALHSMRDSEAAIAWLKARWRAIVGGTFAAHIRPVKQAQGVLRVEADSHEWKVQAVAMSKDLLERINRDWGRMLVREICVELPTEKLPASHELDNHHLPFLRKRSIPKS